MSLGLTTRTAVAFCMMRGPGLKRCVARFAGRLFMDRCNITTIQGEGKWSVHGSPADANHAYFRKLNDVMEELCFGFHADPWKRKRLEDLACDLTGLAPRDHTDPEAGS